MTREQIIQNISAMEQQGATPAEIQEYLYTLGAPVQGPISPSGIGAGVQSPDLPSMFNLGTARESFEQGAGQIQTLSEDFFENPSLKTFLRANIGGGAIGALSIPRAIGAGFFGSRQGEFAARGVAEGLTQVGDVITPQSVKDYVGDTTMRAIEGFQAMPPEEQAWQSSKLAIAEGLSYLLGMEGTKSAVGPTLRSLGERVGNIASRAKPGETRAFEGLVKSFYKSFVDDAPAVNKALSKVASRSSTGAVQVTPDDLIRDLVSEGFIPRVRNKLADFSDSYVDLQKKQAILSRQIDDILEPYNDLTDIQALKNEVEAILVNSPAVDVNLDTALAQVERFFKGIQTKSERNPDFVPGKLNPKQLNQTRLNMNAKTRAYLKEQFAEDVADALAKAVRKRLDEIDPQVRKINVDMAKLQRAKQTLNALQFKPINIGIMGSQIGRLAAVYALGAAAIPVIGPGSLVIAGIVAHMGGEFLAKMIRNRVFSPKAKEAVIKAIRQNPELARRLIDQTSGQNKQLLIKEIVDPGANPEFEKVPIQDRTVDGTIPIQDRSFSEGGTPPTTEPGVFQRTVGRVKEEIENYKNLPPREKQGGFANFGASMKNTFESAGIGENEFRVGITNVAGLQRTKSDNLYQEAISLLEAGDVEKARELYKQAVDYGIKRVKDTFKDTGINVKAKPGLGVFEAVPEPSIDMVATVPAKKVDLFHYQLAKLAGEQFDQKSVITMGRSKSDNLGWVDKNMGISNEPVARFTLNKALGPEDSKKILGLMNENGLYGASIVDNGKAIDIINLSHYNSDYEGFKQSITKFAKALDREKILAGVEDGVAEVRHFGSDSSNGPTTYRTVQNSFESKNPEFKVAGKYQTGLTEALPKKSTYYKKEVEQALKRDTVSPMEREMMSFVLPELGDQFTYKELDNAVMKYLLRTQPNKTEQYAGYGLDSMPYNNAETTLFRTPVTHGVSGHFGTADDFGHMRTFKVAGDDNVYVSEIQADAFQRGIKPETKESLLSKIEKNKEELRRIETDKVNVPDSVRVLKDQIAQYERQLKIVEDPKYQAQLAQIKSYESGNKYRRRLLQETLFEASKKGEKVGIPTPSTVSKFEWNYGNVDDVAPYELPNGRFGAGADDLVVGDEVGYLGEPHIVVDVQAQGRGWGGPPPTMIGIVPEGKANTYRYFDFIDDEIRYRMDDVVDVELNDLPDELTVQNLQDLARDGDDWTIRQKAGDELRDYLDAGGEVQFETSAKTGETSGDILRMKIAKGGDSPVIKKSKLRDEIEDLYREEDWEQYLRDIYGDDHVFVEYGGGGAGSSYGPTKITIVDEGVTPEYFNQPSAYDAIDASELQAIDFDKSLAKSKMSDTEMGVLNNYYEYQEILKKLEKEWDMDIDWNHYIDDDYGQDVSYILVDVPKGFRIKP